MSGWAPPPKRGAGDAQNDSSSLKYDLSKTKYFYKNYFAKYAHHTFEMLPGGMCPQTSLLLNWVLHFNDGGACRFWRETMAGESYRKHD